MFNPSEHLMKIGYGDKAQDYLQVMWRLVWFREQFPDGTIDTEEIVVDLDREVESLVPVWNNQTRKMEKVMKRARGYARFRAVVTNGKGGRATGTKSENAAAFDDFIEKAETGAIGRALAGLGFGTQFTGDEFDESHRIVDSPVEMERSTVAPVQPKQTVPVKQAAEPDPQKAALNALYNAGARKDLWGTKAGMAVYVGKLLKRSVMPTELPDLSEEEMAAFKKAVEAEKTPVAASTGK